MTLLYSLYCYILLEGNYPRVAVDMLVIYWHSEYGQTSLHSPKLTGASLEQAHI